MEVFHCGSGRVKIGTGFVVILFCCCYFAIIIPFTTYMKEKPYIEKIGLVPSVKMMQFISADQKQLTGELLVLKVLVYFGGLFEKNETKIEFPPDYPAMSRILHGAVKLDPYNMDAYYFAQSVLVWDVGQIQLANNLLDYGMRFRTWDWTLPYFAGFNSAYFLGDYRRAAKYYMLAGDLSGESLLKNLAGRYLHETGQTDMAISYLSSMIKGAKNPAIKKNFTTRLLAFKAVRKIEIARDKYFKKMGYMPTSVDVLVQSGYLNDVPQDPYGGSFYLKLDGTVETTSKFSFAKKQ